MANKKRGRPAGWRKKDALRWSVMIRLPRPAAAWLAKVACRDGVSRSEVVRSLIAIASGDIVVAALHRALDVTGVEFQERRRSVASKTGMER